MNDLRVLTVTNFGETPEENDRLTINSLEVQLTAARPEIRQGRPVMKTNLMFKDGACVEVFVSEFDLLQIEQAIGAYGFADHDH